MRLDASSSRRFPPSRAAAGVLFLACAALLACARPAHATVDLAPWAGNIAFVSTKAFANGVADSGLAHAPSAAPWGSSPFCSADNDTTDSHAYATMTLYTAFDDSIFAVSSSGFGAVEGPNSNHTGGALAFAWFAISRTQDYFHYPVFGEGNLASRHTELFVANLLAPGLPFVSLGTAASQSGRLAPGLYIYFYLNYYREEPNNGSPNAFSSQLKFTDVPDPIVTQHPESRTVPAGTNTSFAVGVHGTAPNAGVQAFPITYQWRRNFVNVTNGGRISGATSSQLHIANAAVADTGVYDCIVTQGGTEEPCSLARLRVTPGTADVEVGAPPAGLALAAPSPNPASARTQLRFALPRAGVARLAIYDAAGRQVRELSNGACEPGEHAISWDLRDDAGQTVRAGLYFARLQVAGAGERTTRVAVAR